jgi:hypothetical protein
MEKGGLKMFSIVSAWNKRRRSKSLDQLNPCERNSFVFNVVTVYRIIY